jgi:Domain of unknown function (DUF1918)
MQPNPNEGANPKEAVMVSTRVSSEAQAGDVVVIEGHRVGEGRRIGEVLEVLGEPGHVHYRVRWDDDHESVFYPSSDAIIQHAEHKHSKEGARRSG